MFPAQQISAGLILSPDNHLFITQRRPGVHLAHKWEFPGGKAEAGETPAQALARELYEEIGITVRHWSLFDTQTRLIAEKPRWITLWFYLVTDWQGQPWGKEHQPARWIAASQLHTVDFPDSNIPAIHRLQQQLAYTAPATSPLHP